MKLYLIYGLISGLIGMVTVDLSDVIFENKAKKFGYLKKQHDYNLVSHILSLLLMVAIGPVANVMTAVIIGTMISFMKNDDKFIQELKNGYEYMKVSNVQKMISPIDEEEIKDAMCLDGASEETIKKELKGMREALEDDIFSGLEDNTKKVNAMTEAQQWLQDIELNVGLSDSEYKQLYPNYVKDYLSDKPKGKAVQKTLKMINKRKDS